MDFTSKRVSLKKRLFPTMPDAATPQEWHQWNSDAKKQKLKWFFAETLPDWLAFNFVYPYERFTIKLKNKYIRKHNQINVSTLKDDEWYDTDTRMMHSMFQLLVDFVELEKAHMQVVFGEDDAPKYMRKANYRNGSLGLKYLDWEITLGKEGGANQSKHAKVVKELYTWWAGVRPYRTDLMDVKGSMGVSTNEFYDSDTSKDSMGVFADFGRKKDNEPDLYKDVNKAYEDAEKKYNKEDEQMLIKLVKIRKSLWT